MLTGIVSVTFRALPPLDIIRIAKDAELDCIEWGGDVHCPDLSAALDIYFHMRESGLTTVSFGSYYRVGSGGNFKSLIAIANTLRTKNIRVWAGGISSTDADSEIWRSVIDDTRRIADMAKIYDINISFEYHGGTLTDSLASTVRLLEAADRENVYTYWQPPLGIHEDVNINHIRQLVAMNKLKNIHVFAWEGPVRLPLADHHERWVRYISEAIPMNPALLLEFVREDDLGQFIQDSKILRDITSQCKIFMEA